MAACTADSPPPGTCDDAAGDCVCSATIAKYCGDSSPTGCPLTLADARQSRALCGPGFPAVLGRCGDYDVVSKGEIDTSATYFYRNEKLVAIVARAPIPFARCVAGPADFVVPDCSEATFDTLPVCTDTP